MNWDAIGAVGEWVGAIAVVATLAYLVRQVRDNNMHMRRAEMNAAHAQFSQWRQALMGDAELARLWTEGMQHPEKLTPVELARVKWAISEFCFAVYHTWDRARVGTGDPDAWSRLGEGGFARLVRSPLGRGWWMDMADNLDPAFRADVEQLVGDDATPLERR
jgi:hypothetical protein